MSTELRILAGFGPAGRLLLIDSDIGHLERLSRILRPVVSEVFLMDPEGDVPSTTTFDLLILNNDATTRSQRDELMRRFSAVHRGVPVLIVSKAHLKAELPELFGDRTLTNLLAKNDEVHSEDLIVTVQKIIRHDIFGIEKYFVWGCHPVVMPISHSKDKARVINIAEEYSQAIGAHPRIVNQFCTVVDELVTNAIYNAPTRSDGSPRYLDRPRNEPVDLGEDSVELKLCCNGRRLGVSISDSFGSLTEERLFAYLSKCFRKGDDQVDTKAGGAGLGLYYVFDALSHFIINICPSKKTEMLGFIDLSPRYKSFASSGKSFNVFVER
ncbi:MAG: hypothetical protein NVSMB1_00070 [Polyangiales bacterium]